MPNKQASIKDLRKTKKRTAHNVRIRKNVKALFKNSKEIVTSGSKEEAVLKLRALQQAADKAAKRGIIHKNEARRRVSVAMKSLKK